MVLTDEQVARFWALVEKTDSGCWVWRTAARHGGYGQFQVGRRPYRAHRISWEMANGPIPDGLVIRHDCDNPPCVNPDHLRPGTHADNMADQLARGRRPKHLDPLMSLRTAASILGVPAARLRYDIRRGRLPATMLACWHVRKSAVEAYRAGSLGKPGRRAK
jgi:hypothetical protein